MVTAPAATAEHHSYVDWPAIIAGVVLASAISILMLTFGSAVGLNFTNFDARPDVNPIWIAIAAASWLLWVDGLGLHGRWLHHRPSAPPVRRLDRAMSRTCATARMAFSSGPAALSSVRVLAASGVGALAKRCRFDRRNA